MNNEIAIYGEGKGGKGQHTPVEANDTLQSKQTVKLLFAISEGEIAGLDGVYLNQIPAYENGALTTNFNASIEYRTGTADQTVIKGFTATESPNTSFSSKANMVTATDYLTSVPANVDAARLTFTIAQLRHILDNGDMVGYSVEHTIGVRPITGSGAGNWVYTSVVKTGKTSSAYSWDIRVNRPSGATVSWDIKVTRVTTNDSLMGAKYSSQTSWTACTDITDVVNTYPNTALVSIVLKDAAQFGGQIPEIMFKPKGIKVALPTNYNPTTRDYTGNWNLALTTSYAYTDNPTWHLLHILKATKAHGGLDIPVNDIDLVSFYNLSKYCDQLLTHVVDGVAKNEPRYTLHNQFYARENVPTFLMYLLNICNANFTTNEFGQISLMYDHAGQAITKQVTNANVIEGKFNYSSNDLDSRVNLVNVTYNNAAYYGRTDTVTVLRDGNETGTYIASNDLVSRYGLQTSDIVLPGCSSEVQAIRKARWAIYTNAHLTNFVNFSVLLSGLTYSIGEIVRIYDNHNNQTIQSGLVVSSTISGSTTIITLDRLLVYPSGTCTFYALSTDGITSISAVIASHSTTSPYTITVNSIITPLVNNAFNIVGPSEAPVLVKVVKIDKSSNEYSINCVQHSESKYDYIDGTHSLTLPDWDFSNNPAYVSEPVTNLTVTPNYSSNGVINRSKLQIHWKTPSTRHPSIYKLSWKRDNQEARLVTNILTQGYDILEPEIGTYEIIVWAINPASSITSSAVSTIYAYRTTVSNSELYPPKDIYVLGTSDVTYSTPDLAVSFNYNTLNDTIAVSDTLLNYVVEVWDKNTTPNLKATYTIPVSAGAGIDNNNFTAFTSTATNITKVTNSDNTVNFTKVAGGATAWDSQGYSTIGNTGSCAVRFNFTTLAYRSTVGLSTNATTNANYNLAYCFLNSATTGVVNIYESAILKTSLSGCKVSDIFEVEYISNTSGIVRYKKNGQIIYTSTTTSGRTFYADSSFESVGSSVSNVLFGVYPAKAIRNGLFRFPYYSNIHTFGVPTREFDLKFFSRDTIGDLSNPAIITVNNPKPINTEFDFVVTSGIGTAYIRITPSSNSYDITGYKVWQCLTATAGSYTKTDSNMVFEGPDTYITLKAVGSSDYTYWVAAYDSFGTDNLNLSNAKTSTPLTNDAITWSKTGLVFSIDGTIANKLNWTLGTIIKGGVGSYSITAGSYTWTAGTGIVYVYFNPTASPTALQITTTLATAVAQGCYPIATYDGGDATHIKGGTGEAFISGSQIIAGTVGASQIIAGSIVASLLDTTDAVITGEAQIGSAVINNAAIKDVIQSTNYNTSTYRGWKLDKAGNITTYGTLNIINPVDGSIILSSGTAASPNWNGKLGGRTSTEIFQDIDASTDILEAITSDNILSPSDKLAVLKDYSAIISELGLYYDQTLVYPTVNITNMLAQASLFADTLNTAANIWTFGLLANRPTTGLIIGNVFVDVTPAALTYYVATSTTVWGAGTTTIKYPLYISTDATYGLAVSTNIVGATIRTYYNTYNSAKVQFINSITAISKGATYLNKYNIPASTIIADASLTRTAGTDGFVYTAATGTLTKNGGLTTIASLNTNLGNQVNLTAYDVTTNILTSAAHGYSTGDCVKYFDTGALSISTSLVDTMCYYIIFVSATTFKLATTSALATAGTAVVIRTGTAGAVITIAPVDVLTTTAAHGYVQQDAIRYLVSGTPATVITGLVNGTIYYVSQLSTTTFALATTAANAGTLSGSNVASVNMSAIISGSINNFSPEAWIASARSTTNFTDGAHVAFSIVNLTSMFMIGLNSNPTLDDSYTSIDYAIYINNSQVLIYESGVSRGNFGACAIGDDFTISYSGGTTVNYFQNGILFYSAVVVDITVPLYLDSSFLRYGSSVTALCFSTYLAPSLSAGGASNIYGKIFPGNASTYIANAAIGTAYIADLAVTTAKIDSLAVDTLQIKGNAVTVASVFTAGALNINATDIITVINNVSFTTTGQPVVILLTTRMQSAFGGYSVVNSDVFWAGNPVYPVLIVDGVDQAIGTYMSGTTTTAVRLNLAAGAHTVTVRYASWYRTGTNNYTEIYGTVLLITETKK